MQNEPVSASFRTLIEKCLQKSMTQQAAASENIDTDNPDRSSPAEASVESKIRTESNLEVIRSFLKN